MICKNPRTAGKTLFRNAKVGGSIITIVTEIDTEGPVEVEKEIVMTNDNFFDYLYGVKPDWSTITPEYDGCTVITSKDQIDYSEKPAPTPAA
jgi:hypothetical protein